MILHILTMVFIAVGTHCEYVPVYPANRFVKFVSPVSPIYATPVKLGYGYQAPEYGYGHGDEKNYYSYPKYEYSYGVSDPHTGDHKSQAETRDGDVVRGYYTVADPDGTLRTVHYTADDHTGFNAVVEKTGHALHPPLIVQKAVVLEPVYEKPIYEYGNGDGYDHGYKNH